jgi:hypothetical protein
MSVASPDPAAALSISYAKSRRVRVADFLGAVLLASVTPRLGVGAFLRGEVEVYGTVSVLAGIDLLTRKIRALVEDRHRSREFIEFLELLDALYPTSHPYGDQV